MQEVLGRKTVRQPDPLAGIVALPRVFIDTNVLLDVLLMRMPLLHYSLHVWQMCELRQMQGVISAISLNNTYYVVRRLRSRAEADKAMSLLLDLFEVVPLGADVLSAAAENPGADFGDAVQRESALKAGVSVIVTHDKAHYADGLLEAVTPEELMLFWRDGFPRRLNA